MGGPPSHNLGLGTVCQGGLKGDLQEQVSGMGEAVTELSLRTSLAFQGWSPPFI